MRLFVGRQDCTRLAAAMEWQVVAVRAAIDGNPTPVRPVLCFIDAEWPLFGGPREFQGVLIESDRSLRRRATEAGELDSEGVRQDGHGPTSSPPSLCMSIKGGWNKVRTP
jgi:hypothetical protein